MQPEQLRHDDKCMYMIIESEVKTKAGTGVGSHPPWIWPCGCMQWEKKGALAVRNSITTQVKSGCGLLNFSPLLCLKTKILSH